MRAVPSLPVRAPGALAVLVLISLTMMLTCSASAAPYVPSTDGDLCDAIAGGCSGGVPTGASCGSACGASLSGAGDAPEPAELVEPAGCPETAELVEPAVCPEPAEPTEVAEAPEPAELPSAYMAPDVPLLGVPNPAAAYCEELGYAFEVVMEEGGERGVCVLPDGRRVDAWDFFRGKVAPEFSYCALQGLRVETKTTDHDSFTTECAVCVSADGREVGEVSELMGLNLDPVRGTFKATPAPKDRHSPKRLAVPFGARPPSNYVPAKYDWRTMDGTTAVKSQGNCGSCWAFSTVGALECNILIKDGVEKNLSEQYLVSCNHHGWSCGGGGFAHRYHMRTTDQCDDTGAVLEGDFMYVAYDAPCDCPYPHHYTIDGWGYVDPYVEIPEPELIKRAIMKYGPISAGVMADNSFSRYNGGVFVGGTYHDINHAIVLVGWDDNQGPEGVWFLRNSWGMMWGENGYMRIAYNTNAVGWTANWVDYRDPIEIALLDGPPGVIAPGEPATMTVEIEAHTDTYISGTGVMHYRLDGGEYGLLPLEPVGGGLYEATLPAASCGELPEFFFAAAGSRFGSVYYPKDAAYEVYSCVVGEAQTVFADDFETDLGWTVTDHAELTDGTWERGVPLGGGERSDPPTDCDGSGSCYLTANREGNSDVDDGWTRLTSPAIDLSAGSEAVVEFAYWFRNDHGDNPNEDYYVVHMSDDDGATWTVVDSIGPRAPLPVGWHRHTVTVADHVSLTDSFRVRFEVADEPGGSLVEAALDDVSVSLLSCGDRVEEPGGNVPSRLALRPNAPNPFHPGTVIRYALPRELPVTLTIFNTSGRVVRRLLEGEVVGEGEQQAQWDGRDDSGRRVAAGAYFYRLDAGGETLTAKMIMLK